MYTTILYFLPVFCGGSLRVEIGSATIYPDLPTTSDLDRFSEIGAYNVVTEQNVKSEEDTKSKNNKLRALSGRAGTNVSTFLSPHCHQKWMVAWQVDILQFLMIFQMTTVLANIFCMRFFVVRFTPVKGSISGRYATTVPTHVSNGLTKSCRLVNGSIQ